ncbi:hypothetical protein LXL04_006331 [Taraxacum kok-saghyz]
MLYTLNTKGRNHQVANQLGFDNTCYRICLGEEEDRGDLIFEARSCSQRLYCYQGSIFKVSPLKQRHCAMKNPINQNTVRPTFLSSKFYDILKGKKTKDSTWAVIITAYKTFLVPEGVENNKGTIYMSKTSPPNVFEAYGNQFRTDFKKFLQMRSEEVVSGGCMVLSFLGRSVADPTSDDCSIWEPLAQSLHNMAKEELKFHFFAFLGRSVPRLISQSSSPINFSFAVGCTSTTAFKRCTLSKSLLKVVSPLFEQRLHGFFSTDYGSIEAIPVSRPQASIYPLHDHQLQIPISLQDDASPPYNKTITEFIFAGTDQQWLRSSQGFFLIPHEFCPFPHEFRPPFASHLQSSFIKSPLEFEKTALFSFLLWI